MTEVNPGPGGIYARIEDLGHELSRFVEDVTARMPTVDEASALGLSVGTPILHLVRTAYDTTARLSRCATPDQPMTP
jgi:GntR family transcriptional regulator